MLTFRSCLLFVLAACGPTAPVSTAADGGEGSTEPVDASTSTSTTTATTTTTSGDPTTGGSTGGFVAPPDMGSTFIVPSDGGSCGGAGPHGQLRCSPECNVWAQDCPEGEKCSPYSGDGDNAWESQKCVPLDPDPDHPGDPCTVEGSGVSGIDSCDIDSMCWNVDSETLIGTCVPRCTGSPDDPMCPPETACLISNDGVLTLCLPSCDPLVQDCPGDDLCIANPQDSSSFICVLDTSGDEGQTFDTCEYINACDKGMLCVNPALASECDPEAAGCCLPFCDLSAAPACPGAMQQCLPWFADESAPPGLENVGVCGIPQ
jgi:hypothetical protein